MIIFLALSRHFEFMSLFFKSVFTVDVTFFFFNSDSINVLNPFVPYMLLTVANPFVAVWF